MGGKMKELIEIQSKLKAPKNLYNSFGKYKYRNAEGILEALKPLLLEYGCELIISDSIVNIGTANYVKASCIFTNAEGETRVTEGWARESEDKKGMDASQMTGTASSYARKYALNGLLLIDDTKDADTDEFRKQQDGYSLKEKKDAIQRMLKRIGDEEYKKQIMSRLTDDNIDEVGKEVKDEMMRRAE